MQKIRPDMDIGKNIQAIRYQNKLTQDQVIAKLNLMGISMSKSTYAKLETNRMNIKVSELCCPCKNLPYRYQHILFRASLNRKRNISYNSSPLFFSHSPLSLFPPLSLTLGLLLK